LRGCLQDKSTPQRATSPGNWVREEHPWDGIGDASDAKGVRGGGNVPATLPVGL
jgi:hypothetical protein